MKNETIILPIWTCYFFQAPDDGSELMFISGSSHNNNNSSENDTVTSIIRCILKSEYFSGNDKGPIVCLVLGVIIAIIGVTGAVGNAANIVVLKFLTKKSSLYSLLMLLAFFDFMVSTFGVLTTIFLQVVNNGFNRGEHVFRALQICTALFSLGRTGSAYVTILVTVERLLVVSYPLHFNRFIKTRCRGILVVSVWTIIILAINLPWWLNVTVEKNEYADKFPHSELAKFDYLYAETWFSKNVYVTILPWDTFVDVFLPVPIMLVLNGLLYYQIHKSNKKRELLTRSQFREVNASRMFSKVATILFIVNTCGVVHLVITQVTGTFHHELLFLIYISMTANSCINFFIYYATSKYFKETFKKLMGSKGEVLSRSSDVSGKKIDN